MVIARVEKVKYLFKSQVANTAIKKENNREITILYSTICTKNNNMEESTTKPILPIIPKEINRFNVPSTFVQTPFYVDVRWNLK